MGPSRLVLRHIVSAKGRTSLRAEPEFWRAFREISEREGLPISAIIREIDETCKAGGRTSACTVYILRYFMAAASEAGHAAAGHGPLPERFGS
jgi:predicted DNA-binding ribbon-helix-helix protein